MEKIQEELKAFGNSSFLNQYFYLKISYEFSINKIRCPLRDHIFYYKLFSNHNTDHMLLKNSSPAQWHTKL